MREPAESFFLFGPPTLASQPGCARFTARPERLRERLAGEPGITTVVIGEVQKVPALLDVVHALVEEQPGLRFVLSGSSARKLRRGSWNLLAGRLVAASMHPFLASELGNEFSLERALRIVLVPLVWEAAEAEKTLRAHASL